MLQRTFNIQHHPCLALLSILSYFPTTLINCFRYPKLVKDINSVLQRDLAGYRFVGGVFTDITNEQEIEMLEQAVNDKNFPAVSSHLKRSLALMSDKENSD
ncbi:MULTISPECIES: AbiJ-NTD4 domain-containing protein [Nostoc]|uniref:Uncharacterized protein n=2 Tax=Nostoc TaxID=1177 RepID=A0ABR8I7T8_9NOSO|nr:MULTISPECIES: hypothetical protein [Nostoc]MBD2563779.1 hypothetical protein [Nostoc linckia FACHB-391]MBD2646713.1 hypothetical protein [Nostoc foliaceum FACHB-393]